MAGRANETGPAKGRPRGTEKSLSQPGPGERSRAREA